MTPYNNQTENVIDYLSSLNDEDINNLIHDFFNTDDVEEKMDICEQILTEIEFLVDDEDEVDSEWFLNLHDDLKDLVF
mgnify:CR=1 FL=1